LVFGFGVGRGERGYKRERGVGKSNKFRGSKGEHWLQQSKVRHDKARVTVKVQKRCRWWVPLSFDKWATDKTPEQKNVKTTPLQNIIMVNNLYSLYHLFFFSFS